MIIKIIMIIYKVSSKIAFQSNILYNVNFVIIGMEIYSNAFR